MCGANESPPRSESSDEETFKLDYPPPDSPPGSDEETFKLDYPPPDTETSKTEVEGGMTEKVNNTKTVAGIKWPDNQARDVESHRGKGFLPTKK